jgi:hypothetical protein
MSHKHKSDTGSDADYDHDSPFSPPLPLIVSQELDDRSALSVDQLAALGPASDDVIEVLRGYFLESGASFDYGGFLDCLELWEANRMVS